MINIFGEDQPQKLSAKQGLEWLLLADSRKEIPTPLSIEARLKISAIVNQMDRTKEGNFL